MAKLVKVSEVKKLAAKLQLDNQRVVLVGGGFDILHIGHIEFLKAAKKKGGTLIVLLESDENLKKHKGKSRPIHTQKDRAKLLIELTSVDFVVLLNGIPSNSEYDTIVKLIKPAIIATTKGDLYRHHKERQGKLFGTKVIDVILPVKDKSTSRLAKLLSKEL